MAKAMGDCEYVTHGGLVCPFCRSRRVESASGVTGEARQRWQESRCRDCRKTWRDIYELTGYEAAMAAEDKPASQAGLHLILVWSDVEPELAGPFADETERDAYARDFREKHGADHGIFLLDIPEDSQPSVDAYAGGFFDEEEAAA